MGKIFLFLKEKKKGIDFILFFLSYFGFLGLSSLRFLPDMM